MTLTFRDKIILLALAFAIGIYVGYQALWIPATAKIAELEENKQSIQNLAGDLEPLLEETERLKKAEKEVKDSVNNIKSLSGGLTATNEEFLVFLGDSAKENNVIVSGFNDLGTEAKDGIYRTVFDFELKGSSVDINKVLEDINNMGIKCSIGSISYRQNEGYDYLKRFFDDLSELPWYKEKEDEEEKTDEQQEQQETSKAETPVPGTGAEQIPQQQAPVTPDTPADSATPPAEDKQPESIEDRLNDLLQQTSYQTQTLYRTQTPYKVVFLTNTQTEQPTAEYKAGQQMKLNVTVCLIMYNEPSFENSFLNKTESDSDAIL